MTEGNDLNHIENHLIHEENRWFTIYTKYKCEKYVVEKLTKKSIEAYTPLLSKTKVYTSKKKTYKTPLINCYVFVKINKSQYSKVLETEYVSRFIKQRKSLISIPENEILLLQRIVGEFTEIELNSNELTLGTEVEIISGNLTGIKGKLIEKRGKSEFVVELENIGFQLKMAIDISLLKPTKTMVKA